MRKSRDSRRKRKTREMWGNGVEDTTGTVNKVLNCKYTSVRVKSEMKENIMVLLPKYFHCI